MQSTRIRAHLAALPLSLALALGLSASQPASAGLFDAVFGSFPFSGAGTTYVYSNNGESLKVRINGNVTFNEAETDIDTVSGRLTVLEKRAGVTRMIDIKPDGRGGLQRTYRVNNTDAAYDDAARAWVAGVVPRLIRESGIDVPGRVQRLNAKGGADAVFAEIARIESDHARASHLVEFAKLGPLADANAARAVALASKIDSDYETRRVLDALIARQTLGADAQVALLGVVADMDSSYEQRQVLVALAPKLGAGDAIGAAWSRAMAAVDSDYEKKSVIEAMAKRAPLATAEVQRLIKATREIDSDYERARALGSLVRHLGADASLVRDFAESAGGIDSDYEKSRVLSTLVRDAKLDKSGFEAVLRAVRNIDSDYEAKNLLTTLASRMPNDADLVAAYRNAARQLGDHERRAAERALERHDL